MTWIPTTKTDPVVRALADRHYTRQTVGARMFTRPGYNYVLRCACGQSGWCWWRPKWEHGTPGTERKDRLRSIECTLFRREDCGCGRASDMVRAAVQALTWTEADTALHYAAAGALDPAMPLITAVGVEATSRGRSARSLPGQCYRMAGWVDADPLRRPPINGKIWLTRGRA